MSKDPKPKPKKANGGHNGNHNGGYHGSHNGDYHGGHARPLPALVPHPALVPQPPPRPAAVKDKSRRNGLTARTKAQIEDLKDALDKKQTKVSHVVAGGAGAIGCTLGGAFIVNRGWLSPKWASLLLTTVGAGATFAGWYYEQPIVMWGGAGWTFAGAAHTTMAVFVDARRKAQEKAKSDPSKPRNAPPEAESEAESDIGQRLRLSQERARELEMELARARQRLNPEIELAAA